MKKEFFDPICGVEIQQDIINNNENNTQYFCSKDCKDKYFKNKEKYDQQPLVRFHKIWKVFKIWEMETEILKNISFNIWKWEFIAIVWPSWSWKSTTLNMIWLLDHISSGEIYLNGNQVASLNSDEKSNLRCINFGFIFQQYNLMPWLTAYENITLPLIFAEKDSKIEKIEKHIKNIWLENRMKHKPLELSWWEQQRVALLRALVNNPEIIIGDEPTWNLDSVTWKKILKILMDLNRNENKTLIIVTHDHEIAKMADRIIKLKDWKVINWNSLL